MKLSVKILFSIVLGLCLILCGCSFKPDLKSKISNIKPDFKFNFKFNFKHEKPKDDYTIILERGKLIVGVKDDTAPFGFKDEKGNLQGYDIDLAKIIASSILGSEDKLEFVPVTTSNRIMKLSSGEVDMLIATMTITSQREAILNFSEPYYMAGQAILVKNSCKYNSLKEFKGKRLIVVFGSTSEQNLRTNVPEVDVIGFKTYNEAFDALKAGKAEGIVADDTVLMNYALKDKSVKLLPKRYSKEPYAVAFRRETNSASLKDRTDYIIESLRDSGKLDRMREKWKL